MPVKALVQTRIDADVKERATVVLENMGMTVSDAVRILLTRTAKEGALPIELLSNSEAHDAWFRAKVREALEDDRADVDDAEAEAHFAERRASALRKNSGPVVRLVWSQYALADREAIFRYIEAESPRASVNVDDQIIAAVRRLLEFPESGRPGRVAGTRELVVPRTPFIAAYAVAAERVRIRV